MILNKETGWLDDERKIISPHFNLRPDAQAISLIVIHNITLPPGEFGGGYIDQLFGGTLHPNDHPYFAQINREVSAHVMIDRQGRLTQYVSFYDRAWHAGQSCYQGRENCNDFSIGIELEGTDETPFTSLQYETLTALIKELLKHFPNLSSNTITGHSDIALGRKTDPGPYFDWQGWLNTL